jgi:hypothetical protein
VRWEINLDNKKVKKMFDFSVEDIRAFSEMKKDEFDQTRKDLGLWDTTGIDEKNATEALFKVDDCLKEKGIRYWLCYGTALGMYRDGNFIPWDDDVDIHTVASEFEPIFDELIETFINNGIICRAVKRDLSSKMSLFYKGIKIQLQGIYETEDMSDMIQTKLFKYPKRFYYSNAQTYNYKGRDFTLPGPADEYLTFCYDKDWNTPQNIPDWRDYMNIDQIKDESWKFSHNYHNNRKKGKK